MLWRRFFLCGTGSPADAGSGTRRLVSGQFKTGFLAVILVLPAMTGVRALTDAERVQIWDSTLKPYEGKSERGVDGSTLVGKVMCGYQGWFNTEGDGSGIGWRHWISKGEVPGPENIKVDFWPDVSELAPERFTPNQHLVIAHANPRGIRIKIWVIIRENINHFHHPIGICSRGANP